MIKYMLTPSFYSESEHQYKKKQGYEYMNLVDNISIQSTSNLKTSL